MDCEVAVTIEEQRRRKAHGWQHEKWLTEMFNRSSTNGRAVSLLDERRHAERAFTTCIFFPLNYFIGEKYCRLGCSHFFLSSQQRKWFNLVVRGVTIGRHTQRSRGLCDAWWIMRTGYLVREMARNEDKTRTCGLEIWTIRAHLSLILWQCWQNNGLKCSQRKINSCERSKHRYLTTFNIGMLSMRYFFNGISRVI